ncbi:hypothetical protein FF38_06002 [Lucilia cuprina]|uniref:Uncharacterized protein n=1 Tax=Lucilia cuprina TaxID=7375 RepID=A0A0L0CPX8_LUCCU|nr:hypothetical protein FF38_06002 [Lucilia cuprina]
MNFPCNVLSGPLVNRPQIVLPWITDPIKRFICSHVQQHNDTGKNETGFAWKLTGNFAKEIKRNQVSVSFASSACRASSSSSGNNQLKMPVIVPATRLQKQNNNNNEINAQHHQQLQLFGRLVVGFFSSVLYGLVCNNRKVANRRHRQINTIPN